MKVSTLLEGLKYICCQGSTEQEVSTVVYDSRKVEENSLFICIRGAVVDGHKFVPDVIRKGAKTLVVEEEVEAPEDVTVIKVADTRYAMAFISAAYFGHPAEKLKTIGITGTKGKTTTTYMVKSILENAGYKVGLIGTIEAIIGEESIPASNTTPESYLVQEYFRKMVDAGCDCVVMEVSSQGLMLHRTQGFVFDYGIFTNIEPDHIGPNEHKDFDDYLRCKSMLLQQCRVGIVNRDDEHFERIIEGHTCQLETYGFSPEADLRAEDAHMVGGKGYLGISYQLKGLMEFPVEIDIPGFIKHVAEGDFEAAYNVIAQSSALPAVCGRVCPQEHQCEGKCVRGIKGEAVGIGRLERFVADWYRNNVHTKPTAPAPNGHKVAVIGAGPSGLTVAGDLAKLGYKVTVYEALHVAGGVLMYGIPEFRLPKDIVQHEVEGLKELGVDIETNMVIGKVLTIDELMNDYGFEAVYVASGAGLPRFMGIPGESLNGVYSANEYLTRVNLMKAYKEDSRTPIMKSKSVAVVGGGNVAMDAARCAKRLGAENVYIVYRRGMAELPARKEEVEHAEEEGIVFKTLTNPTEVLGVTNYTHF